LASTRKLDEPWDSPANRQLLERMPAEFRHPAANAAVCETWCFAVVGAGTVLGSDKGTAITEITDEAHNTLLVVEAHCLPTCHANNCAATPQETAASPWNRNVSVHAPAH
jgi:hypothetical protein